MRMSWGIKGKVNKHDIPGSLPRNFSVMMLIYEDVEPLSVKMKEMEFEDSDNQSSGRNTIPGNEQMLIKGDFMLQRLRKSRRW